MRKKILEHNEELKEELMNRPSQQKEMFTAFSVVSRTLNEIVEEAAG